MRFFALPLLCVLLHLPELLAKDKTGGRNFYKILGVTNKQLEKDPSVLKRKYRNLAKKWHPDKNPDNQEAAQQKFVDISDAYETLSDPEKKRIYDQVGEEGMKQQQQGGGGQAQAEAAQKLFEQFFGGGGGFSFGGGGGPFGGGGSRPAPEKSIFKGTKVAEWNASKFEDKIDENLAEGEYYVVAFYRSANADDLKQAYADVQKQYADIVDLVAVNCGKHAGVCKKENINKAEPVLVFFSAERGKIKKRTFGNELSTKAIGKWISNLVPDGTMDISDVAVARKWAADEQTAKVVLFTEKKSVPPMIKVLAAKFKTKVTVGLVKIPNLNESPVAKLFGVEKVPSVLHVTDRAKMEGEFFTSALTMELLSLFFSRAMAHFRKEQATPRCRELTNLARHQGQCGPQESQFCLIYLKKPAAERLEELNRLAEKLRQNPVKVYWLNHESDPVLSKALSGNHNIVLWRPKKKRWKAFEETFSVDAVATFVDNAVNGGSPLPEIMRTEL